jgi:hypothetical protein
MLNVRALECADEYAWSSGAELRFQQHSSRSPAISRLTRQYKRFAQRFELISVEPDAGPERRLKGGWGRSP